MRQHLTENILGYLIRKKRMQCVETSEIIVRFDSTAEIKCRLWKFLEAVAMAQAPSTDRPEVGGVE
jgi:hypothetical protein